jgi:hypothetical protein
MKNINKSYDPCELVFVQGVLSNISPEESSTTADAPDSFPSNSPEAMASFVEAAKRATDDVIWDRLHQMTAKIGSSEDLPVQGASNDNDDGQNDPISLPFLRLKAINHVVYLVFSHSQVVAFHS